MASFTTSTTSAGDGGVDDTVLITHKNKPLPLSNFNEYTSLVKLLYVTSPAMILGNSLEWLDFGIYGYSSGEISGQ